MALLKDVIAYIIKNYPHKSELSNARLTKMIYLSDWHQSLNYGKQITDIKWYFDNYGPFVWDIYKEISGSSDIFEIKNTTNFFGNSKTIFNIKHSEYKPTLTKEEKNSVDHTIEKTKSMGWTQFINLVYSTYPVISSDRYSLLDLLIKSAEYKEQN